MLKWIRLWLQLLDWSYIALVVVLSIVFVTNY